MAKAIIIAFYLFMVIYIYTGGNGKDIAGIFMLCTWACIAYVPILIIWSFVSEYHESTWNQYRKDPWTGKEKRYELVKPTIRGYLFAILKGVVALLLFPLILFIILELTHID